MIFGRPRRKGRRRSTISTAVGGDEIHLSAFDAAPATTLCGRGVAGRRLAGATDVCEECERLADRYGPEDFE